ncbi:MAG: SdrD B-like domain-containing protein [Chloroflexota bacterium]
MATIASAAPTIDVLIDVAADGTAQFEDWSPTDSGTVGPTPNGIQEPGDDLNGDNGYVRTGDVVLYEIAFNVNDDDATNAMIVLQLNGDADATFDLTDLPLDLCDPNLSTISSDGRTVTCVAKDDLPEASTYVFTMPAYVSYDSQNGDTLSATVTISADGASPAPQTSENTTVSASPRWNLQKSYSFRSISFRGGEYGFETNWRLRFVNGNDADPRGDSALETPITFDDRFEWSGNVPSTDTFLVAPKPACEQLNPGDAISCSFDNMDSDVYLTLFTPFSEIDGLDGSVDSQGSGTLVNSIGFDENGVHVWDPDDTAGVSNWGDGTENPADNISSTELTLGVERGIANKSFIPRDNGSVARVVDNTEIRGYVDYGTGATGTVSLVDPILCDKFDNSRFTIRDIGGGEAVDLNLRGNTNLSFEIEYGYSSNWGTHTAPNDGTDDATDWYAQNFTDCSDSSAASGWFSAADVDWTNSNTPGKINAADVNMVRAVGTGEIEPTNNRYVRMNVYWTVLDNDAGEYLINTSAFYDESNGSWLTSSCHQANHNASTCPNPPVITTYDSRPGTRSDVYIHVDAPVSLLKEICDPANPTDCTTTSVLGAPGNIVPFKLYPTVGDKYWFTGNTPAEPTWPTPSATAQDVVVTDILPFHLDYVPGSATVGGVPQEPTIQNDTPGAGETTLTWDIGAVVETDPNSPLVIEFDARVSAFAVNLENLTNLGSISSPSDPSDSKFHEDQANISIRSSSYAIVDKTTEVPVIGANESVAWDLSYGNLTSDNIEYTDWVDIFPYNGDPIGSSFNGDLILTSVTGPVPGVNANGTPNPVGIWISDVDGTTLDNRDGSLDGYLEPVVAYGSYSGGLSGADWPCQIADAGTTGCPALANVTAIRIIGLDPDTNASGADFSFLAASEGPFVITLNFDTNGNQKGDMYHNKWGGRFEGIPLPVWSPDVAEVYVFNGVIGDFVWFDDNSNGVFDAGDYNAGAGVVLNLLDENGNPVLDGSNNPITTVTDANGRYLFTELEEGNYIVEVDASNFQTGGALAGATVAPNSEPSSEPFTLPNNEDVDHNASNSVGGGYQSNVIKLTAGGQPLNDDVENIAPSNSADEDNNLTIDFAFVPSRVEYDYGDLPDTYGTTTSSNGPSHEISQDVYLGTVPPDAELDGQPTATATGDDVNGSPDDEDGVVFLTPMVPGTTAQVEITTYAADDSGYLSLYIDFNGDGDFDDVGGDHHGRRLASQGTHILTWMSRQTLRACSVCAPTTDDASQGGLVRPEPVLLARSKTTSWPDWVTSSGRIRTATVCKQAAKWD